MGKIDFDKTNEAFRAGNRARKKESVQDTVDSVYSIQEQIEQFREQTGYKLELRDGKPFYNGNLDLEGYELTVLPQGLTVKGWMGIRCNIKLTALPQGLIVEDSLSLAGCTGLTCLPADLYVGGFLTLIGCSGLTSLPDGLTVGRDIELGDCTGLTSLPDGLAVNGCLNLCGCTGLTSLPAGLKVGKDLWLKDCTALTSLSADLEVKGELNLRGCTGLTSLPDGLKVGKGLDLRGCTGLTSLPAGLTVGGFLWLRGCTGLTSLPFDLVVQGVYIVHKGLLTPFFKKLGIRVDKDGDTMAEDWREWQEAHGYLTEAFKAGNRARKKEAVQDNTDAVSKWRIPKKLETIDDWEAAFLLNAESVGITAAPRQSDSPNSTTRIYNLYVRSWENNTVTFSVGITKTDFYSSNSPFGIMMRIIFKLNAAIGNISMHMVPATDTERNTSGRKIFTDLSAAMDSVWEIISYLRNSRHIDQVLRNPLLLELDSSDVTMLIIDEYLRSEPGCPLIWNPRDEYQDFLMDYESELRRAAAVGPWINWHGDTEVLAEAFKAGNRARKKESISGTSNIASTRIPSITELGDMLLDLGFLVRSDKRDYADVRREKAPDEIDSILFSKWYTPSGKVPESGPIKESMIMIRGGYGLLNNKESGQKIPYISVEIHVDMMLDKGIVGKYKLSTLSSSWSSILNLTFFNKVDKEFMPRFDILMKLWSDSDRILKGLYDMVKDNLLLMRVDQYIQKAYIYRLLCRLMPEFESWIFLEEFGSNKEIDPDSWQWQASGWIKMPEAPEVPVNEAFRAGNRARKKETVQDTVSDNVDPVIKFEDPNVEKICHEHGVYTIGDAARVETIQGWFEIDGNADNPEIVKFNELKYFTGLTTIPANAFLGQEKLEKIIIPDNVTVIGQCAFDSCKNLSELVLPDWDSLELGNDCFQSTGGLNTIVVPSGWSKWECIQNMKEAYDNELVWCQEKIDNNHIDEDHYFELLDYRLNTGFENRQGTLACGFSDLLQWWSDESEYVPDNEEEMDEAFGAGNRARKKESVQDNAEEVDSCAGLSEKDCAELLRRLLINPVMPPFKKDGGNLDLDYADPVDKVNIRVSTYIRASTYFSPSYEKEYSLVKVDWTGVDPMDPAQNIDWECEVTFTKAIDNSNEMLVTGGYWSRGDLSDWTELPEMSFGFHKPSLKECDGWRVVDPDGMVYSEVNCDVVNAIAAVIRTMISNDRRKDPSTLGKYPVGEAFKAGNRARKKEAAADTVQDTDTFIDDKIPTDKIIPNLFLSAVSTTQALLRIKGSINPPFKPEFPEYMKWFINIITTMYIKTSISWQHRISIMNVKGSPDRNNGQEFDIILETGIRKYHFLITPGNKENRYAVWFKMTVHLFDIDFNPDYPEQSDIHIAPAMKYFIAGFLETYRMFFEEKGVLEAFKAGNRARKKESTQDVVNVVKGRSISVDDFVKVLTVSGIKEKFINILEHDIIKKYNLPFKIVIGGNSAYFTYIIIRNDGQNEQVCTLYWYCNSLYLEKFDGTKYTLLQGSTDGYYIHTNSLKILRNILFDLDDIDEAFKVGNRARKKESAQDAADVVDTPVRFWDPTVRRYMEDHEIMTMSKVANTKLLTWDTDENEDWFRPERFNEFKLFTSMTCIESLMFNGQENLEEIELPPTIQSIGYGAFRFCQSLESIDIPNSCKEIGEDCFAGCDSLEWIYFPDSWTYEYAFEQFAKAFDDDITYLPNILADNNVGSWDEMPFPDTTITNKYYTFHLSDLLKKFSNQESLMQHGLLDEAFRAGNRARKKESAQDTVESIDSIQAQIKLFKKQTGKKLKIRDGHPYFNGNLDLENCTRLTDLPVGLKVNGFLSLIGCTGLTSLPAGLKVEETLWLDGCTGLTSLPDDLEVKRTLSLTGCTGLASLPNGLKVGEGFTPLKNFYILHKGLLTPFFKKLGILVDKDGDTLASDWHRWQKAHGYLTEAFRAGNRARKKETAVDMVNVTSKPLLFTEKEISDAFRSVIDSEDNPIRKNALPGYEDKIKPAAVLTQAASYSCEAFRKLFSRVMAGPWGKLKITWEEWQDGRRWGGWTELGVVKVLISQDDFKDSTPVKVWRFPLRIDGDFEDDWQDRFAVFAGFDAVNSLNTEYHTPMVTIYIRHNPYKIRVHQAFVDGLNKYFFNELDEAFKAGNKARKKETSVDTVESVNVKITKEEVAGWFRDVIESDRNTIPKDNPHAWPAMCLVNDVLFTRLAINKLADKIKESDSDVIIDHISHGQLQNPKGFTLGFVDVTAVLKSCRFSWHWNFKIAIEDYNKGKEDYCYKLYVNSQFVNSESLVLGPKNEPLVTVYTRRTPYEIEVNEKFVDGINRILK